MLKAPRWVWVLVAAVVLVAGLVVLRPGERRFAGEETWTGVDRIVAVGDVHGDFDQFVKALRAARVIDEKNDWIAGKTHLVQTGDVLDRGPDSRKAMDLLMKLEDQASKAGGMVHALIGNHEAMVLLGSWGYVSAEEKAAFGGAEAYREAMSTEGKYGRWIRGHNTVIRINDILFVHAGIMWAFARQSPAQINTAVRRDLEEGNEHGICMDLSGPLWDRTLAVVGDEPWVSGQLEETLKRYGVRRMVVGHTVSTRGIFTRAGGRVIGIDVGMYRGFGGPAACLLIENGVFYEVRHPETKQKLRLEAPAGKEKAENAGHSPFLPSAARRREIGCLS